MRSLLLPEMTALCLILLGFQALQSSPDQPSEDVSPSNPDGKFELPAWVEGEFHGCFDIRIWPDEVIRWLEQETLRDLISDPETPEEERESLKQVLANQNAWRNT